MENRNPNIPPFGGRILHNHPRQPPTPPPPPPPPQYQSQHQQQPQVRGPYSIATNSKNTVTTTTTTSASSTFLPSSSSLEPIVCPNEVIEFRNIVEESRDWSKQSNEAGPLYDFILKKDSNRSIGWCRNLAGISTSRLHNPHTLQYYDLLLRCAPSVKSATVLFYHAFDMNRRSLNRVKLKRKSDDISLPQPSPILKRIRTHSRQSTTTPAAARRVTLSPHRKTPTKKTPPHITKAAKDLYNHLTEKTSFNSAEKGETSEIYKVLFKRVHSGWEGGRCDSEAMVRMLAPSYVTVCRNEYIQNFKKKCDLLKTITKSLKKKRFNGNRHAQNFIAAGAAMTPNCSANSAETFVACVRRSLLYQYGFDETEEEITRSSPSSATVTNALANLAASCLNQQLKLVAAAKYIFGSFDKGHRAGVGHFVKMLSFYNRTKGKTEYFTLDMDEGGNSSIECAHAVKHSMVQKEVDKKLSGQTTDNGGGGTLESFHNALKEEEITNTDFYFVANCTLHDLSLSIAVPVEKVLGLGGLGKNNFMQMLHSIYDLQKFYGPDVWKHIMETEMAEEGMEGDAPNKMPQPVTTRWWWLGISCEFAIKYWNVYRRIAKSTVNVFSAKSYGNVVASSIDALMKEELFYGHTVFIMCYSKFLINPHFDFLQSRGFHSKAAAFNCEAVVVRLFLIYEDFHLVLEEGWKNHPSFDLFNEHLADPRWMTVEQGRQEESEEEVRRKNGPKDYEKKLKQAIVFKKGIEKELRKKNDLLIAINQMKRDQPTDYWISMSASTNKNTLDDIMALFELKNKIFDTEKNKIRQMRISEKQDLIAAMEPIEKNAFDFMHTNNHTRIMKLEFRMKEIGLGLKQTLYKTFDLALTEQMIDKTFMSVPLRDLFMLREYDILGDDDVTQNSVSEKMIKLKEKIETITSDNERLDQRIKDRDPLPEDENEEHTIDNDVEQDEGIEQPPPTEGCTQEEINTKYINVLSRQATIFIEKGFKEITTHFKRWANALIFFGIASESPTAMIVANLILGQTLSHNHDTNTYYSSLHKRAIDLDEFAKFLQDTCEDESLIEVRESYYYKKYVEGIKAIANGEKLWESSIPCVKELREFVEDTVLAIASNQQFVELAIKECMNATVLNRSVAMKSVIGIVRSYLNREKADMIEMQLKTRSLHANQHTGGGIKGERTMKNKTKEEDLDSRYHAKGFTKTNAIMQCVAYLNKSESKEEEQKILRLGRNIKKQDANYARQLVAKGINRYDNGRNNSKKINDDQRRRDIEHTNTTTGRIPFSKLFKKHMDGVKEELTKRGHNYSEENTIFVLRDLLKVAVKSKDDKQQKDDKSFHPRTETLQLQFENAIRYSE